VGAVSHAAEPARLGGYGEFRDGWPVVLSAMLGIALGATPIPFYTMGLFAPHLAKAFHWGFGEIQFGLLVSSVVVLVSVPLVGLLADRIGVRVIALTSLVLFGLSFMSFALSTGSLTQYYVTWCIMGLLGVGTLPITWTRAINAQFDRRKGLALGLCLAGTGVFGMLGKPLVSHWIDIWGWRGAYVATGLLPILIAFPVALAFFREGAKGAPKLRDRASRQAAEALRESSETGLGLSEALRDWRFWLLAAALTSTGFALGGPTPNMENILGQHGFTPLQIVSLTPFIGASVIVGRLLSGWLMDRIWAPAVAFVLLCVPAGACLLLASSSLTYAGAFAAIGLIGMSAGMESDLVAFLVARYFGLRKYASIYGLIYVCYGLSGSVAAGVFGRAFDKTHSYSGILTIGAAILVVGATSFLTLGRYRYRAKED
jgi:MFS family permease